MTINGGNRGSDPDVENVTEKRPDAEADERGRAAHHGDQEGPSSADAGTIRSPQTGRPESPDPEAAKR
jgi:hypothetical protein